MTISREELKSRIADFRQSHWLPIGFFVLGFLFDMALVERIDSPFQLAQIAVNTLVLTWLLRLRVLEEYGAWTCSDRWRKLWKYQEFLTQFLLGALLNLYSLFYFKSASLGAALIFLFVIAGLILANEFVKLEKNQVVLVLVLYLICVASLWIVLIPTLLGFVGTVPFLLALTATSVWIYLLLRSFSKRLPPEAFSFFKPKLFRSGSGVILFFLSSYYLHWIPPVPLAVQYFGIFHELRKENGEYVLLYNRPWWKFWQNGDQTFLARPGDRVVSFASVFAPSGFKDQLNIRWLLKTSRGWEKQDLIPITVSGGRDEGFRGYTVKANYQPGTYRVQVETTDGREVGRIGFEIVPDDSIEERVYKEVRK